MNSSFTFNISLSVLNHLGRNVIVKTCSDSLFSIGQKNCQLFVAKLRNFLLTSSLRTPKFFVKEFSYFLMPCHQHGLRINLLVQR